MSSDLFSFKPASEIKRTIFDTNREIAEIEDYLEICRICDKSKEDCLSCFIWQEIHNCNQKADHSSVYNNFVTSSENKAEEISVSADELSQKFFDKIVKKPLEGLSKSSTPENSYINASVDIVKNESWREVLKSDSDGRKKISKKRIKTFERLSKTFLTISSGPRSKSVQRTVTTYDLIDRFDEVDCQIIILMNEDHHQAEIARILGKSRQAISYRIKKILKTGLVKVLRLGKFIHYKPSADLLNLVYSKLNEIRKENKNSKNKVLERVETAEPNRPDHQKQPAKLLSDVHHIIATVKVYVDNVKALRLKCQNCPKFEQVKKYRTKCSCKGARYVRMTNWDFHAVSYKGYEISTHNGRSITVSVKGIRVLVDWRSSQKPSEQVYYKAKDIARNILESYFDRFYAKTKINVRIDWASFRIKGTHLILEENEDLVKSTQQKYDSQTVAIKGDVADTFVDESADDDGIPHPHVEAHVKDLTALDYYHDLLNGKIHEKLSQLEASLAPIRETASVYGGMPTSTGVTNLIRKFEQKLEDMHRKLEHYAEQSKLLTTLKTELSEVKSLLSDVRTAIEALCSAIKDVFFETFVQLNNKHVGELNRTLSIVAHLLDKVVTLEEKINRLQGFRPIPDPGGDTP